MDVKLVAFGVLFVSFLVTAQCRRAVSVLMGVFLCLKLYIKGEEMILKELYAMTRYVAR